MGMSNAIEQLVESLKTDTKETNRTYSAVVARIDNESTVWVYVAGSTEETPTASTSAEVNPGDTVNVEWRNNKLYIVGNYTSPAVGTTRMLRAEEATATARQLAVSAGEAASEAWAYADTAKDAADAAQESADDAQASATTANTAANNALTQLSIVEDVAGTLNWISEHGGYVLTEDDTVVSGTVYFVDQDGDYVPIVNPDSTKNPSKEGWFVLDVTDSQSEYIMAHLAVTSAGLWVLPSYVTESLTLVTDDGDTIVTDDGTALFAYKVPPQYSVGYKVLLASNGMTIYNSSGEAVANYGTTTTIGATSGKHVYIDDDSVDIMDGSDTLASFGEMVSIGDASSTAVNSFVRINSNSIDELFNDNGTYYNILSLGSMHGKSITRTFTGDGSTTAFLVAHLDQSESYSATVNGTTVSISSLSEGSSGTTVTLASAPASGSTVVISYTTKSNVNYPYFTFGTRASSTDDVGFRSFSNGTSNTVSGSTAYSTGAYNTASGDVSVAFGYGVTASGNSSFAVGYGAKATGDRAVAENYNCVASGEQSHAQNRWTIAASAHQTAIGQFNVSDSASTYAFIIGNGSSDSSRSNAMTVKWGGNTTIAGTLTQSSDRRLKEHKSYLSDDAVDFINGLKPAFYIKDGDPHLGFYAQDVEEIDSWNCMVGEMNGYKTLGYTEIIAPLVAYCQRLEARISELEKR